MLKSLLRKCSPAALDIRLLKSFNPAFLIIFILFFLFPSESIAEKGKNYVYRTKDGKLLLTDRPQKEDYADLVKVFESRKEQFFMKYGEFYRNKYETLVEKYAMLNGLDSELVHAVIQVESGYDFTAVSPSGAKGLMQLMDPTADSLGVLNVFDPKENIRAGTEYLAKMMDKYSGNLDLALAAYNAGPTAVDNHKGVPGYKETRNYIKKIKRLLNGATIVPKYTYETIEEPGKDKKTNLTWERVNGKLVIKNQSRAADSN